MAKLGVRVHIIGVPVTQTASLVSGAERRRRE